MTTGYDWPKADQIDELSPGVERLVGFQVDGLLRARSPNVRAQPGPAG
jgi:hypothetical protein